MPNLPLEPTLTAPLFPRLYATHLAVLRQLSPEQWQAPTACAGWSVHDVALHMLADDVGWLSSGRDGYREQFHTDISNWDDLIAFINQRNDLWVRGTRRISPHLLTELADFVGDKLLTFVAALDPFAPGPVINWAGSDPAPMWMQIGRELTERWMHHQHICDGAGITSLKDAEMVHAVMAMFIRALPHTYRDTAAPAGSAITLTLTGDGGDSWSLLREADRWRLYRAVETTASATITLPTETAWRLFTKGISPEQARAATLIVGDQQLANPLLHMVSILA